MNCFGVINFNRRHLTVVLVFFSLLCGSVCFSQNSFWQPFIKNYPKSIHGGGTQTWQIDQDSCGIIYLANNDGLISFDGQYWNSHPLPNGTICRSLLADGLRIYVGGQGEFGFFEPNKKGKLKFSALSLPDSLFKGLEDFWSIHKLKTKIIFRNNVGVVEYSLISKTCKLLPIDGQIEFIGEYNDGLIIQSSKSGFWFLDEEGISKYSKLNKLSKQVLTGIVTYQKGHLFTTLHTGIYGFDGDSVFSWKTNMDEKLMESSIYKALGDNEGGVFCATSQNGLVYIDSLGKVQLHLDKYSGLQNNNVLSLFFDKDKNLWLGLDNGVDYLEFNSPFSLFFPDGFLEGSSYCGLIWEDKLVVGTNNGLFSTPWKMYQKGEVINSFSKFLNINGQVWGLSKNDSTLFVNHHDGLFIVNDSAIKKLNEFNGSWVIQPYKINKRFLLEGTYSGVNLYEKDRSGEVIFKGHLEGLEESSRFIVQDNEGFIWMAHPYKGIYRFQIDTSTLEVKNVIKYNNSNGLNTTNNFKVFEINNEPYFVADKGLYRYNYENDLFFLDTNLNKIFSIEEGIRYLYQGRPNEIWFVNEFEELGKLTIRYDGLSQIISKEIYPFLKGKLVNGFEFLNSLDENKLIIGTEKGMVIFQEKEFEYNKPSVFINSFKSGGFTDSTYIEGRFPYISKESYSLPYTQNNLAIHFSAPVFAGNENLEYQFQLEGFEKHFSEWSSNADKEYTNLSPGNYTFKVRARLENTFETELTQLSFVIQPPWYRTKAALFFYFFTSIFIIFTLVFFPRQKFEKEKIKLKSEQAKKLKEKEVEHQRVVQSRENEVMKLRNEKLKNEINFKNQELAASTMNLVQKSEMLNKIKNEISKVEGNTEDIDYLKGQLKKVKKLIADNIRLDKSWDKFANQFDKVHVDFNNRLKEKFPDLTPNEKKLCAYLRMNLTTKEIAPLMNISVRGVEISRYRLRKKLKLDRDENLNSFIAEI